MTVKLLSQVSEIEQALHALRAHHRVPGASLAIRQGDSVVELSSGVTNVRTGVEVTPETLFQIGSNTKVYTTTLIMQLVEEGQIALDHPVREYLPEFHLMDREAETEVTVRHLLNHTSGIEGDHFEAFGPGNDSIALYVGSLAGIGQIHRPGERFSYCNAAFVVAGRIIEVVTGKHFHEVFEERLRKPLGLQATTVLIEEMIGFRYAAGHYLNDGGEPERVVQIMMDRSAAPAGSVTSATAADVLRFVQMHLDGGRAPDGARVLTEASVKLMQTPTVSRPGTPNGRGWQGLGWRLDEWDGHRVIGHGGGTNGQLSFLEVLPDEALSVVLLTNSSSGGLLWRDLGAYLFDRLAGVHVPGPIRPTGVAPDLPLSKYEGTYERLSQRYEVFLEDGAVKMRLIPTGPLAEAFDEQPEVWHLTPLDRERFYFSLMSGDEGFLTFADFDAEDRPGTLFLGRLARRVGA